MNIYEPGECLQLDVPCFLGNRRSSKEDFSLRVLQVHDTCFVGESKLAVVVSSSGILWVLSSVGTGQAGCVPLCFGACVSLLLCFSDM